ncbi:Shy1p [Sugiyamaella lignohabitans]|uniref:SURF1-like protein n=1 Tax=Sugiyamaella lignohabitans TaxID=796027 RepID=A0A167D5L7_9ASCO|nr:Shy1p [Sugiyamaella lignohabitans]ANB12512.1 Shy1p [Sugiyamaella lignohabitans]
MPVISFGLGTWQVKRLKWKQDLIARAENSLALPTLPLPPVVNPSIADKEFDFRRVTVTGTFRHDQEMLVAPRLYEGEDGYYVLTPLERKNGSKLLIFRGWIAKRFKEQSSRPESLVQGEQTIECMLRQKPAKNFFTPPDEPEKGNYYFMSIDDMAASTGSQPVYIQALENLTYDGREVYPEILVRRGIPIGKPPKVEFRNTHFQYIVTWYGLSALTTAMLFILFKQRQAPKFSTSSKLAHARSLDR